MTTTLNALTQAQRATIRGPMSLLLVDIQLSTTLLHLSTAAFVYQYGANQVLYEPYLSGISGLEGALDIWGKGQNNPSVQITVNNNNWGPSNTPLVLLNETQSFAGATVTVYELRLITMFETFATDVRTVLWKGAVESVGTITQQSFVLTCSTRIFAVTNNLPLQKLTASAFPQCDNADIGQYRNILYGNLEFVPARCLVTGGGDSLALAMTATQLTAVTSGNLHQPAFLASGTIQIDMEEMTYSAFNASTQTFTLVRRGVNGTVAATHVAGAYAYQILSAFVYEVAQHPVQSIGAVYVDGILQPSTGVYAAYTGGPGNQLPGWGAVALIVFYVNPKKGVAQQINVGVNYGSHTHAVQSSSQQTVRGASASITGVGSGAAYAIDGNSATNAALGYSGGSWGNASLYVDPVEAYSGQLLSAEVHVTMSIGANQYNLPLKIYLEGLLVATLPTATGLPQGEYIFSTGNAPALNWASRIQIYYPLGSGATWLAVFEVTVIYTFTGSLSANTDTSQVSTAQMEVGGQVTCMCTGYQDTATGTYTGAANALIQQPDAVFRHILIALLGFTSADIGACFASSAASYGAASYLFAFILHDVATDAQTLLADLAQECASAFWDWGGQFELLALPSAAPAPQIVMDPDQDAIGFPQFDYTGTADIKNLENVYYRRDYRAASSGQGLGTTSVNLNPLAVQKGYMDMQIVQSGSGNLPEDLELKAVRQIAMALSVGSYILGWKATQKRALTVTARWNMILGAPGQFLLFADEIYGANVYLITDFKPHAPDMGQVQIVADCLGTANQGGYGVGGYGIGGYGT